MYWNRDQMPSTVDDTALVSNLNAALKSFNPYLYLSEITICGGADNENSPFDANIEL